MNVESKYFSRIFSFLVNSAISALESRYGPLVEGQKEGPFISSDISPGVRCLRDRLMILIFSASAYGVPRFLTTSVLLGEGWGLEDFDYEWGVGILLVGKVVGYLLGVLFL